MVLDDPDLRAAARLRPSDKGELCRTLVAEELLTTRPRRFTSCVLWARWSSKAPD